MVRAEHLFAFAISRDGVKTDSCPEKDRLLMALGVIMDMEWLGGKVRRNLIESKSNTLEPSGQRV